MVDQVIERRCLLGRLTDCVDFAANEGEIEALSGLCVSTPLALG